MSENNYKKIRQVLWIILLANLVVAVLKVAVGVIINSTSMTADGFHSLTDGSSNIVGLIGIRLASKPVDEDHPYGHGKFETLGSLFIAGMLIFLGGKIIVDAISGFANPTIPEITVYSLVILLLTLITNIFISFYEYKIGKKLGSIILMSDSMHTRSDIFISAGVLLTLGGIKFGLPPIFDSIVSLVVAGFILYAACEILNSTTDILVDKAVISKDKVREIALCFHEVKDVHDIRSRGGCNKVYVDMHIMTEPDMSVQKSHELMHEIENKLKEEINSKAEVIVHIEPYNTSVQN